MLRKLISSSIVGIVVLSMVGCNNTTNQTKQSEGTEPKTKVEQQVQDKTQDKTTDKTTQHKQPKQVINNNDKTTENHVKQPEKSNDKDTTSKDKHNYDDELYGNAARGTCPDCGRTAMVFNHGYGLKCAYCGFYDDGYFLPEEEPDPSYTDNQNTTDDTSDDYNYDEPQDDEDSNYEPEESIDNDNDVEESPSEPVEQDLN